jgi:hypothetical protein
MAKKRGARESGDPLRTVVQGVLNLVLGALATWLAARITDWILGPAEEPIEEEE